MDPDSNILLKRIRASGNLPTLSAVAMEVLELTRADRASMKDLAVVIEKDPALTLKILRLVNSAFFGMPREVASVHRAVVILGIRTTKLLTLGFSLTAAVTARNGKGFDYRTYWRRSIIHAVTARLLAKLSAPRLADEAFIAGLLADVGLVATWQCVPEAYEDIVTADPAHAMPMHEVERRVWGLCHARIGEDVLEHWNLPESLCRAVGAHHGDRLNELSGETLDLARIGFAAAGVAAFLCGDPPPTEFLSVEQRFCVDAGLSLSDADRVFNDIEPHVVETASLLSVDVDTTIMSMIQSQATLRMAQLTRQMEAECSDLARREGVARRREAFLVEEQKEIIRSASTDFLTGLNNRAVFDRELALFLTRAARSKIYAALLMLDVDHFKTINDTYGHPAGDAVLRAVAKVLSGTLRTADVAVRYGGEEFAVITGHDNADGAGVLAERIRAAVGKEVFSHNDQIIAVTISIGVALWWGGATPISASTMTESADNALYAAKRGGRNQVQVLSLEGSGK